MGALIGGLLSVIGSGIGGFFGLKQKQGEVIQGALQTLGQTQDADAQYASAAAESLTALYTYGSPVERLWRPILMWLIMFLIIARWFGFQPAHLDPVEIQSVYQWMEIGLIGYMPLRSLDKWMTGFQVGKILTTYINKKIG